MLKIKRMAKSTFYYHIKKRCDKYELLRERINQIFYDHDSRYGSRRVFLQLRLEGVIINHKVVTRLMHEMGLFAKRPKRKYKSYHGVVGEIAPNVLQRDFATSGPNQKWTTDVSQMVVKGHRCYISSVLDMWNGEIISFTISNTPNLQLVMSMMRKAIKQRTNLSGLIMHSDQGWHYQHDKYQNLLRQNGIIQSMSRKGNCLDNAMMENFFGLMKNELLYVNAFADMPTFVAALKQYITYYNNNRIKLRLKMSPVQYRLAYHTSINNK